MGWKKLSLSRELFLIKVGRKLRSLGKLESEKA